MYSGIEARYEIDDNESHLLRALTDDVYQMIMLLHPMDDAIFKSQRYFSERLSVMLPKTHRLADRKTLTDFSRDYFLSGNQTTVLAYEDGLLAGCASVSYVTVMPTFDHPTGRRVHLMNVNVRKNFRRKGIAQK